MPVENIQLSIGHRIDQLLNGRKRLKVTRSIHQNSTMLETRSIINLPRGVLNHIGHGNGIENNELRKSLNSMHSSERIIRLNGNLRTIIRNHKGVRLISIQLEFNFSLFHLDSGTADSLLDKGRFLVENHIHVSVESLDQFVGLFRSDKAEMLGIYRHSFLSIGIVLREGPDVWHISAGHKNKQSGQENKRSHTY